MTVCTFLEPGITVTIQQAYSNLSVQLEVILWVASCISLMCFVVLHRRRCSRCYSRWRSAKRLCPIFWRTSALLSLAFTSLAMMIFLRCACFAVCETLCKPCNLKRQHMGPVPVSFSFKQRSQRALHSSKCTSVFAQRAACHMFDVSTLSSDLEPLELDKTHELAACALFPKA